MKKQGHLNYSPPETVVMLYSKSLAKKLQSQWELVRQSFMGGEMYFFKSDPTSLAFLLGFGIGAPAVAAKVSELSAFGVKKIISLGTGGGLKADLQIGDLVLCEEGLRDEGTSYHYLEPHRRALANKNMIDALAQSYTDQGLRFHRGCSWTTDSPYRETREEVKYFRDRGASCVEMELSALYAAAEYHQVAAVGMVVTSDLFKDDEEWEPRFHFKRVNQTIDQVCRIIVEAALDH